MEVYFGNFSREKENSDKKPGLSVSVQKHFEYGGFRWVFPRLYLCEEGIVLDICREYDASEFKAFYEKWADKIETLSPAEQEQITKENPMNFLCDLCLYLDGKKLQGGGWSGTGWQPIFPEQNGSMSEQLMEEYGLSRDSGWYMYRAKFPYQAEVYASLINDSNLPKRLTLQVAARKEQIYFDTRITTEVDCEPFSMEMKHPLTGETHQFFVGACSAESFDNIPPQLTQDMIIPEKNCVLVYAVAPELPAEEVFCVQDESPSDTPIPKENGKSDKAASAIGIIGSADGPTSIFLAENIGGKSEILKKAQKANADKEVHWKTVCSSLTFEPVKDVTWKCSIQVAPFAPVEIPL